MVVIVISAILSSVAILYGSQGRNQIALSVETAKITQLTLQAKQLAIATYSTNPRAPACGYGMYFNIPSSSYSLFIYSPQSAQSSGRCPSFASTTQAKFDPVTDVVPYSQQSWQVHVAPGLVIQDIKDVNGPVSAVAVIFFPPNHQTLITNVNDTDGSFSNQTSYVDLATVDGSNSKSIMITSAGQVTF